MLARAGAAGAALAQALLIALMATMTLVCLAQVLWRYAFDDPLTWSEELSRYLFVWIGYLGAWLAWRRRQHIALDAAQLLRSPALRQASARLVEGLVLAFCIVTAVGNVSLLGIAAQQPSAVLQMPMAWVYLAHTVMALLIAADIAAAWAGAHDRPA